MGEVGFAKNSQYRSDNVELYLSPAPPKWHNDKEILPLLCLQDLAKLDEPPHPRTFQNKTCLYHSSWLVYTAQMMHLTSLSICIWKTPGSLSFEMFRINECSSYCNSPDEISQLSGTLYLSQERHMQKYRVNTSINWPRGEGKRIEWSWGPERKVKS